MGKNNYDIVIIGAGIVGLTIAYLISEKQKGLSILILDKENKIGAHSSGRNSGVLHAGIYYKPNTLKANVSVKGAKLLKEWCLSESLPILSCGKVISPQSIELDPQLDMLLERGKQNGAKVEMIDSKEFYKLLPHGRTSSGRALWSPNTAVVKPYLVLNKLMKILIDRGVKFQFNSILNEVFIKEKSFMILKKNELNKVFYGHLFNCAGVQADRIAKKFDLANGLTILPFKGIYWELKKDAPFKFETNLYPVPDLNVPFLGVHVTPSPDGIVNLGPTAIPAFGRENYRGFSNLEPIMSMEFLYLLLSQFFSNKGGFRRYAMEQSLQGLKPIFLDSARLLVPKLQSKHLKLSSKVGIRAQLFDKNEGKLLDDFYLEKGLDSTHILNAISPAFTASFALAEVIIKKSSLNI